MIYPSVGQYTEAIKLAEQSPEDYFATLTTLRAVLDDNGNPVMSSGNFAVVFKMQDTDGKIFALKCFTRDQEGRNESYRLIADELQYVESEYLTKIQYLEKELFVDTNTGENEFPVLLMDWVEGETLDKYIKNHISEPLCLEMLACDFAYLADWLLKQSFAHGDLKPDNIIVKDDGSLVIVDYDGMYVPKMRGQKARELGSPDFRHPQRTEDDFDEHIDDFAVVTILLSLKALSLNNKLLDTLNSNDCVLLHTQDFSNLAQSTANQKLQELIYDKIFARIYAMFVVVLAEKVIDMAMLESVISIIDRKELKFKFAKKLCNEGKGSESDLKKAFSIFEDLSKQNYIDGEICYSCCFQRGYGCVKNEEKGDVLLEYCALKGSARAQRRLGGCYYNKKNYQKAIEWYSKAAEQGNSEAQYKLGYCFFNGKGCVKDYKKAVIWYAKAAEQGDASAQSCLSICYFKGYGVEPDYLKAFDLTVKAAEQGEITAEFNLGVSYEFGYGIKKDYQQAFQWYMKAAMHGDERAQHNLGNCFANGLGVEKNEQKAIEWYTKSAEQGYANAQYHLGVFYKNGRGVQQDYQKAVEWFTKAAEQGLAMAQNSLGVCYHYGKSAEQYFRNLQNRSTYFIPRNYFGPVVEFDYQKAVEWYTKAAEQGNVSAQVNLGLCYYRGDGVEKDYQKAVDWYTKAAEQGDDSAQNNLGVCYEKGYGVEQDNNKAIEWYTKAKEQGNEFAKSNLNRLLHNEDLSDDLPF